MSERKFIIRCRGIILHEGKLLVVRHAPDHEYVALPGGRLEWKEDVMSCIKREIVEELGIEPHIGRLLYVNTFINGDTQTVEFFFEILNGQDYLHFEKLTRTHAHEISGFEWIDLASSAKLLPLALRNDFKSGNIIADKPRFISDFKS